MIKINPYILGDIDPALFVACLFFAFLGVMIVLLAGTKLRDPNSGASPSKFSWKYLWNDNLKRIILNIVCVVITLRFMPEITGWDLSVFKGLCIGLAWDGIFLLIKQKTAILDPNKKV